MRSRLLLVVTVTVVVLGLWWAQRGDDTDDPADGGDGAPAATTVADPAGATAGAVPPTDPAVPAGAAIEVALRAVPAAPTTAPDATGGDDEGGDDDGEDDEDDAERTWRVPLGPPAADASQAAVCGNGTVFVVSVVDHDLDDGVVGLELRGSAVLEASGPLPASGTLLQADPPDVAVTGRIDAVVADDGSVEGTFELRDAATPDAAPGWTGRFACRG